MNVAHAASLTLEQFAARLGDELGVTDWRAVVMLVVAAPELHAEIARVCAEAVAARGLAPEQLLLCDIGRDERGRQELAAYNRARDRLLAERRLICLVAGAAEDVRFFREVAPDLGAAVDAMPVVRGEGDGATADWESCRRQICELMRARHGTLDFTGLLPADVERRELPLDRGASAREGGVGTSRPGPTRCA